MFSKTKVDFERQTHLKQKLTSYVGSLKILLPNFDLHLTQPQTPTFQTLFAKPFWISISCKKLVLQWFLVDVECLVDPVT